MREPHGRDHYDQLQDLNVCCNHNLKSAGFSKILEGVVYPEKLTHITAYGCRIDDGAAIVKLAKGSRLNSLEVLDMSRNHLGDEFAKQLATVALRVHFYAKW